MAEHNSYGVQSFMTCLYEEKLLMTIEEKANRIIEDIRKEKGINPINMFKIMAKKDYISIHGPEHHILDGACLLMAYYNAGGKIDIRCMIASSAYMKSSLLLDSMRLRLKV